MDKAIAYIKAHLQWVDGLWMVKEDEVKKAIKLAYEEGKNSIEPKGKL